MAPQQQQPRKLQQLRPQQQHTALAQSASLPAAASFSFVAGVGGRAADNLRSASLQPPPASPCHSRPSAAVSCERLASGSGSAAGPLTPLSVSASTTPRRRASPVFTFPISRTDPKEESNTGGGGKSNAALGACSKSAAEAVTSPRSNGSSSVFGGSPRLLRKLHAVKAGISFVNNLKLGGGGGD